MEREELKEKIKTCLSEYLKSKGIETWNRERVLNEIPNLWRALEASGLVQPGMTYKAFHVAAFRMAQFQKVKEEAEGMADTIFSGLMKEFGFKKGQD